MKEVKWAFLLIISTAVIAHVYLLLRFVPRIHSRNSRTNTSPQSLSQSNVSHVEGRPHRLERDENSHSETLVPRALVEKPRKIEVTNGATHSGPCFYRIQVYNRGEILTKHRPALKTIVEQSHGKADVRANVSCSNDCIVELTIAGDENKFAGMDAVVFHFMKNLIPRPHPPAGMNPNQTWVYFSWESPWSNAHEGGNIAKLPVHVVWTYYRGSDLTLPYGYYDPKSTPMARETKSMDEWLQGKTKLIAWMASNCKNTVWPRSGFVREMQKYIQVDVYGACGKLKCTPSWDTKCTVDLVRQYKFYLSLENAECEDYITEKLWNKPLTQGVVPIVYGPTRKVYEDLLPPNSFIYIGDYKSMKELVDYIKLLDSKPELYVEYLKWQYKGNVGVNQVMHESYDPGIFCNLIPFIDKVKRDKLRRIPVGKSTFSKTCRKREKLQFQNVSAFGLGGWEPW
ncbi:alpha-(1,3)-fucosyltransferase 7-like [Acanthaster planci]|uniref:Fucosyltransferase n=1 Tax=Acanthaster planci TaxID=133434 RepID=A0A8B7YWL0_ACAPL|nr:alpha-(1,3)-fucosyltransferase 7-like [Acanthaster planci]